jgi:hypothetical protein
MTPLAWFLAAIWSLIGAWVLLLIVGDDKPRAPGEPVMPVLIAIVIGCGLTGGLYLAAGK